jgi:hypothetical protein
MKKQATCHPDRITYAKNLCKSCYNGQWKPTKEQNRKRNSTAAARCRKLKWFTKQGINYTASQHRLSRYGLTLDQYENMLILQSGKCKVCLLSFGTTTPCVDHDHATGQVRSLLCSKCNAALGMVNDNGFNLARLVAYLAHHGIEPQHWRSTRFADLPTHK